MAENLLWVAGQVRSCAEQIRQASTQNAMVDHLLNDVGRLLHRMFEQRRELSEQQVLLRGAMNAVASRAHREYVRQCKAEDTRANREREAARLRYREQNWQTGHTGKLGSHADGKHRRR